MPPLGKAVHRSPDRQAPGSRHPAERYRGAPPQHALHSLAAAIDRTPSLGIDPGWTAQRVHVVRWVLPMKREANAAQIDALLAATGHRPIVEVSTRDPWWGARLVAHRYEGENVLGRLWMELRRQLRDDDPASRSGAWVDRNPRRAFEDVQPG